MRWWELPVYAGAALAFAVIRLLPRRARNVFGEWLTYSLSSIAPRFNPHRRLVSYRDILEAVKGEAG
jgi:hypothetical protein